MLSFFFFFPFKLPVMLESFFFFALLKEKKRYQLLGRESKMSLDHGGCQSPEGMQLSEQQKKNERSQKER